MTDRPPVVGILYPGEMGSALAGLLRGRGFEVITTLDGRSSATAGRATAGGMTVVASLADVARAADVVVSLVLPDAAEAVARAYCEVAHAAPAHAVFVDANSIGPDKAAEIGGRVERAGRAFVDASINGLARNLVASGTLYLSGARADDIAGLFEGAVRVRVLEGGAGRASAMKMLLGGLSKGVCSLFTELALLADRQGMLEEMLEAAERTYPEIAAVAGRMLPTYPRHAARRHTEMNELAATAASAGVAPCVIDAVRRQHAVLAAAFAPSAEDPAGLAALVERIADRNESQRSTKEKTHGL